MVKIRSVVGCINVTGRFEPTRIVKNSKISPSKQKREDYVRWCHAKCFECMIYLLSLRRSSMDSIKTKFLGERSPPGICRRRFKHNVSVALMEERMNSLSSTNSCCLLASVRRRNFFSINWFVKLSTNCNPSREMSTKSRILCKIQGRSPKDNGRINKPRDIYRLFYGPWHA